MVVLINNKSKTPKLVRSKLRWGENRESEVPIPVPIPETFYHYTRHIIVYFYIMV